MQQEVDPAPVEPENMSEEVVVLRGPWGLGRWALSLKWFQGQE